MAEGIALLAAYGEDADEEEEDETEEAARPAEAAPTALEAGQEQPAANGGGEKIGDGVGDGARPILEGGAGEGGTPEQNGVPRRPPEQASGWRSPEERHSPKKSSGVSPMGSRAGSKSPLDVGRLGRSPLGQSMELAGVEKSEENERTLEEERAEVSGKGEGDDDDVSDFLPPPPESRCSDELQRKFAKWVDMLRLGQSYNDAMRRSKPYKNPDFLEKVVAYHGVDEIGSCFAKDVFDPHGLPEEDYYDNLAAAQRQEAEQREQEKRKLGKLDFVKGGVQAPIVAAATGPDGRSIQLTSIQKVLTPPVAKAGSIPPAAMAAAKVTDIRPGKRTKWDKVEDKSGLPPLDAVAVARERAAAIGGVGNVRPTSRK